MRPNYSKLEDVAEVIDSLHKTPRYSDTGYSMVRCTDVKYGRLSLKDTFKVDEGVFQEFSRRYKPKQNDIVITRVGSYGNTALVEDTNFCLGQNTAAIIPKINPRFLYFALNSAHIKKQIEFAVVGSTQKTLSLKAINNLEIPRFEPLIEDKISEIASSIDDKIDLNRRINQTLEATAQAIFKSWFVDFDPVKAKIAAIEQGQDPLRAAMRAISGKTDAELDQMPREQHDQLAATAALFPDAMEESELGEIPKGWTPTPIRDVAEVVKGKSYSSKDLVDNDQAALVTLKSFERGGGFRMDGFKPYVGPYKPEQVVLPGDLIVAYTDVTQAAELIGKPAVVVGVDHFKTLVASLDVGIIRPLNKRVSRQFLYGLFMTDAFQSHTFAHTSGTTVLHLSKEGVPSYSFACPDERLVSFFSETAEAMAMEKQRLIDQNRSLATLRDALLPKLLSGELSVENLPVEAAH